MLLKISTISEKIKQISVWELFYKKGKEVIKNV